MVRALTQTVRGESSSSSWSYILFTKVTLVVSKKIIYNKNSCYATCKTSCMPQISICRVTIINKGIQFQCIFFAVPGNGPAFLGMPDCENLQLLGINCQMTTNLHKRRQIMSKQSRIGPNQQKH